MNKIKIFEYQHPSWGIAFKRISEALRAHAPDWVEWTNYDDADIMIVHVVGAGELEMCSKPKPKVIIQQCYFTAGAPDIDYIQYWEKALLTVSFHDLTKYTDRKFSFLALPWGADPDVFTLTNKGHRSIKVLATGHVADTEGIDKLHEAVQQTGHVLYQTGSHFGWPRKNYTNLPFMDDKDFSEILNATQYVSALRFIEGFELMAIEGLMCGARPIVPNDPTYDWYREHAVTIDRNGDITSQLVNILKNEPTPVTEEERKMIVDRFSWNRIISDLFNKIKEVI